MVSSGLSRQLIRSRVFLPFADDKRAARGFPADIAGQNYISKIFPNKINEKIKSCFFKTVHKARIFIRRPGVVKESDNLSLGYPRGVL